MSRKTKTRLLQQERVDDLREGFFSVVIGDLGVQESYLSSRNQLP